MPHPEGREHGLGRVSQNLLQRILQSCEGMWWVQGVVSTEGAGWSPLGASLPPRTYSHHLHSELGYDTRGAELVTPSCLGCGLVEK